MSAVPMPRKFSPESYRDEEEFGEALVKEWTAYAASVWDAGMKNLLVFFERPYIEYWSVLIDAITDEGWVLHDNNWDVSGGDWYGMFRRVDSPVPPNAGKALRKGALTDALREKAEHVIAERSQEQF